MNAEPSFLSSVKWAAISAVDDFMMSKYDILGKAQQSLTNKMAYDPLAKWTVQATGMVKAEIARRPGDPALQTDIDAMIAVQVGMTEKRILKAADMMRNYLDLCWTDSPGKKSEDYRVAAAEVKKAKKENYPWPLGWIFA